MSQAKDYIERISNNTYGIEVEFGTHNSQVLSFTHITVSYIYPANGNREDGWKIETDADYTLELVSPILTFETVEGARAFRDRLMNALEQAVRPGITLGLLLQSFKQFLERNFIILNGVWRYSPLNRLLPPQQAAPQQLLPLSIDWINAAELLNALTWENWDEDTDLEQVLATRSLLNAANQASPANANQLVQQQMEQVVLVPSRKHGGLPSSQLNLPLPLNGFVYYETYFKRNKAWDRLLETRINEDEYTEKKRAEVAAVYPELATNEIWSAKYMNRDYMDSRVDEKIPIWHRYWLWLETFYISAGQLFLDRDGSLRNGLGYLEDVNTLTGANRYYTVRAARAAMNAIKENTTRELTGADFNNRLEADFYYLTVYKLSAGALSEMSETLQMQAQQKIMALEGDMDMDQIRSAIPNNQFMQFHYALKDLTSMWFKATLEDCFTAEAAVDNATAELVGYFKNRLRGIGGRNITATITNILTANLQLLGWYYGVCAANNQAFDYDWEEFCGYNMPSIAAFSGSVETSANALLANFEAPNAAVYSLLNQLPQQYVVFLKRFYVHDENGFPGHTGHVAPWEGRWDTMKRPIAAAGTYPRYLVEHRNH